jgi:K+-sensing histidine kinase KdpD
MKKNISIKGKLPLEGEFLRTVRHDMRSKLTSMLAYTQLLQKRLKENPDSLRLLNHMEDHIKSFGDITTDMTDALQYTASHNTLATKNTPLEEILDDVVDKVRNKKLRISKKQIEDVDIAIDENCFQRMLLNLIQQEEPDVEEIHIQAEKKLGTTIISIEKQYYTSITEKKDTSSLEKLKFLVAESITNLHKGEIQVKNSTKGKKYLLYFPTQ